MENNGFTVTAGYIQNTARTFDGNKLEDRIVDYSPIGTSEIYQSGGLLVLVIQESIL